MSTEAIAKELYEALKMYSYAGIGNSANFSIQSKACGMADKAIAAYEASITEPLEE